MDGYEKRVKYLDYLEDGTKIKNGGFIRTEKHGNKCRVQISVRGLYPTDTLVGEILLYFGTEAIRADNIQLHYGAGNYASVWDTDHLADSGADYKEWSGVEIIISERRKLQSVWEVPRFQNKEEEQKNSKREETAGETERAKERENADISKMPERQELSKEKEIPSAEMSAAQITEKIVQTGKEDMERTPFADLYEDKWQQLEQYYKKVRPFGDKRSYLSLTPRDFIVLGGKYQKLVSNSFLLHGYYNYGHVVLGRQEEGEHYQYYIGVPGIYHEREKQVARMFGFSGFEGAVNPSAEGGFGYYMTAVEI